MHWKGLRLGPSDATESKRRSLIDPNPISRHSEQLPRNNHSTSNLNPRSSESAPRSSPLAQEDGHETQKADSNGSGNGTANPTVKTRSAGTGLSSHDNSTLRRNRFSFMKLRHASDPQLSKSYAKAEQDVPPVPSLPPPTIITTSPTSHELDQPVKRKSRFNLFSDSKKNSVEDLPVQAQDPRSEFRTRSRQGTQDSAASQPADPTLSASGGSGEEAGRLSTNSISNSRDQPNGSHRSSATDMRFSESSRSDQSLGDRGISRTNSPRDPPKEGAAPANKRFRMPRWKRNRGPLFPLPPKPASLQYDSNNSSSAMGESLSKGNTVDSQGQDHVSPLPSPSRSGPPPLLRKDSETSAHSAGSTPSNQSRRTPKTRTRSSTLDSLANVKEHEQLPSPNVTSSARTSTSTSGRKSFGDLFSITNRLRQNSEPPNGSPTAKSPGTPKSPLPPCPERQDGDTPATYLERLEQALPRGAIAGILSQSNDDFFKTGLRKYMRSFSFFGDPIDMAIRKLLMEVELPKETQQIDRFLQSFADRYHECNPGIFASPDQAYFIAFSILILHTDVFNKNNKRKMQRPDYVKNTRGEGISEEILECFYENITYTPFIHIEDPNNKHVPRPRRGLLKTTSSDHLSRPSKEPVDPYTLIMDGKIDTLRPSLKDVMDLDDTYTCNGTSGPIDMDGLHESFAKAGILQIVSPRSRPDAFMPASIDSPAADSNPGLVDIKIAKIGLIWRKDPKKKRARSPWQEWGALLTLSQLYFFRDVAWVKSLMSQHEDHTKEGRRRAVVFKPPISEFKPDNIMSTEDAVALIDAGYKKHKHAFVFVRHNALEEVFLANNEADMNDWLAKLNYAATFRTTGVRPKATSATNYDVQRNRMSRRGSVMSTSSKATAENAPPSGPDAILAEDIALARKELTQQKIREANEKLFVTQKQLDDLLRNARHLQVLTPVHARARENVIMAAGRMSAKLKWVRQDMWRTKCYREVLVRDLGDAANEDVQSGQPPLHLQIPSANPAAAESDEAVDKTRSPSVQTTHTALEEHPASTTVQSPTSPDGRRPSVPTSITSELATRPGRRPSTDDAKERAKSCSPGRTNGLERDASILSTASKVDVASLASRASKLTGPGSAEDGEERLLRDAGLIDANSPTAARKQSLAPSDADSGPRSEHAQDAPQGDQPSRIRRSLHRTLRDSSSGHHGHYIRSKKSRDSAGSSMAGGEDGQGTSEGEGLSRKYPSFTVHGKKASIVTFGSEWQNMPSEERLKLRKPTPSEEPRASDPALASTAATGSRGSISSEPPQIGYPQSMRTASTATRKSVLNHELSGEPTESSRRSFCEDKKAKSDDAIADMSGVKTPILTLNAPPADQASSHSASNGDSTSTIDETTPQQLPPSPREQAVNA